MTRKTTWSALTLAALSAVPAWAGGGPLHLHLSAQRKTEVRDANGKMQTVWVSLSAAVHPGDVLRYDVRAENTGPVPISGLAVTQPVPAGTVYLAHSAEGAAAPLYSLDGKEFSVQPAQMVTGAGGVRRSRPASADAYTALRWRFAALPPHASEDVTYQVKVH